jgi:CelD/BcsL family acetyltransferase involved in cellulose biosynthesis
MLAYGNAAHRGLFAPNEIGCTMDVMRLRRLTDFEMLQAPWRDLAAGHPMRGWDWQSTWWTHYGTPRYGGRRELFLLAVLDGADVIGIAPWLLEQLPGRGSIIRFLGEEEVCTEYPTVLCRPENRSRVTAALADFLTTDAPKWDVLELLGVEADNAVVNELVARLAERGLSNFSRRVAHRCWKVNLPRTWDDYVQALSKSHRVKLRRLQKRSLDPHRLTVHRIADASEFDRAWKILVDLHQRRRQSLGEPGCFASSRFASFHETVARQLLANGELSLMWCERNGRPTSAEYNLTGAGTTYAYQGGLDPEFLDEQPGRVSTMTAIRWAIESGHTTFDFLRGDEPYKSHWGAQPIELYLVRVVAERAVAQLREAAYQAAGSFKDWCKASWQRVREPSPGAYAS